MIPADALLADVRGAFNAVLLVSRALGPSLLYGQGAGGLPTGVSVVSDVVDCARNLLAGSPGRVPMPVGPWVRPLSLRSPDELVSGHFLRFSVDDRPGVLAAIASVLGARGISIAALTQKEPPAADGAPVPVTVVTHDAKERDVRAALEEIDRLPATRAPARRVRIERRPPLAREG
jgi:homoserine dehydrogenase